MLLPINLYLCIQKSCLAFLNNYAVYQAKHSVITTVQRFPLNLHSLPCRIPIPIYSSQPAYLMLCGIPIPIYSSQPAYLITWDTLSTLNCIQCLRQILNQILFILQTTRHAYQPCRNTGCCQLLIIHLPMCRGRRIQTAGSGICHMCFNRCQL